MIKAKLKGKVIRKILFQKNKSQNWLAYRVGISSGYMAQLLNGDRHPSPKMRQLLLDYFEGYSFNDLFRIKER